MAFLSVREFSDEEGVSPSTVRRWISLGLPTLIGPSGVTMLKSEEAQAWLEDFDEDDEDGEDDEEGEDDESSDDE